MFSGITKGLFSVVALDKQVGILDYKVALNESLVSGLTLGASIAVNGVCHTVASIDRCIVGFQSMQETLARTTLDRLQLGDQVSIERSICLGDEIGGHQVSGHVDGVAEIIERIASANNLCLRFRCQPSWMKYILHKGFIALDGSSLTVNQPKLSGEFEIHFIPETSRLTNFANYQVGDHVNLEIDRQTKTIVDAVENVISAMKTTVLSNNNLA